jgi:branched-chain amino acid transport system substrate-binding protein
MRNKRARQRKLTAAVVAAMVASTIAGCASSSASPAASSSSSSSDALTVGIITIDSGPYAAISKESIEAAQVTAQQLNAESHKYKINIVNIDTDGTPTETLQAVEKAVQSQGVHFVSGFFTSDTAPAVNSQAQRLGILVLAAVAQSASLVGSNCGPNYFQFDAVDSQYALADKALLATAHVSTWDAVSEDYAAGHDKVSTFSSQVTSLGGTMKNAVFPAFGSTDDGTQITQLLQSPAQGLFIGLLGADAVTFAKQAAQFGLFSKYKYLMSSGYLQQPLLSTMGNAVAGTHEVLNYSPDAVAKTPFAKGYAALDKSGLWHVPISGNLALTMLDGAADKAASTDPTSIAEALGGLTASTIVGTVTMRAADHLLLQPLYPAHAVAGPNGPKLVVDSEIPASQTTPPVSSSCHM